MIELHPTLAFLFGGAPGIWEIVIVLLIALLLFGKRLPEVGKSLGKGIVEFKKGLHGLEDEVKKAGNQQQATQNNQQQTQLETPQKPMDLGNTEQQKPVTEQQAPATEQQDEQQT